MSDSFESVELRIAVWFSCPRRAPAEDSEAPLPVALPGPLLPAYVCAMFLELELAFFT